MRYALARRVNMCTGLLGLRYLLVRQDSLYIGWLHACWLHKVMYPLVGGNEVSTSMQGSECIELSNCKTI